MITMKDSSIDWIGYMPQNWCLSKMKYIGEYINGFAFKPSQWGAEGKQIIRIQDLTQTSDQPNYFDGELDKKYLVKAEDLLVSWAATLDAFVWNKDDAWLNQHIFKAVPKEEVVRKRYFYWLIKEAMRNMNNANKHGIMMQHVTYDVFDNFSIPLPPLHEQDKIADFLERKCTELDALIAAKEKSNILLREQRKSIIYEAVTKGLNPDASMKDSGIEWIGYIPEHWYTLRLRFLGAFQNGISKAAEFFGSGHPFVSYGDVYKNEVLPAVPSGLVESTEAEQELYSVQKGDVFFTRTSETKEEIGIVAVCKETIPNATFAGFLIRMRPTTDVVTTDFLRYYFSCGLQREYFSKEMTLVTRASLGQDLLKNMIVTIPSIEEQHRIVNCLDMQTQAIDNIIISNDASIQKLKEYRQSIIYEAVTGKIEV